MQIFAGMATTGGRGTVYEAARSLANQVDKLFIYDNSNGDVDKRFLPSNCEVLFNDELGDVGDLGKFEVLKNAVGINLTVDDDISYPSDYVERLLKLHKEHDVVGVHGVNLNYPLVDYYSQNRLVIKFDSWLDQPTPVDVVGTGTALFDHKFIENLTVSKELEYKNAGDILLKRLCAEAKISPMLISRTKDWLSDIGSDQSTIYNMSKTSANSQMNTGYKQTGLLLEIFKKFGFSHNIRHGVAIDFGQLSTFDYFSDLISKWGLPSDTCIICPHDQFINIKSMPFRNRIISNLLLENVDCIKFQPYEQLFCEPPIIQPITLRKQIPKLTGQLDVDGKSIKEIFEYLETCMASKVMTVKLLELSSNKLAKQILAPHLNAKSELHFRGIHQLTSQHSVNG